MNTNFQDFINHRPFCAALCAFPFQTTLVTDPEVDLRAQMPPDHRLKPFVSALHAYERNAFNRYSPAKLRFRELLRYQREVPRDKDAPSLPQAIELVDTALPTTYDDVCGYISALRLVEAWGLLDDVWRDGRTEYVPKSLIVHKTLTEAMVKKSKLPYWEKIQNLPHTLLKLSRSARTVVERTYSGNQAILRHLLDLAVGQARSELDFVIENFRVAAWNLSFIASPQLWSSQDSSDSDQIIPDLPKQWDSLIVSLAKMDQNIHDADVRTIRKFLRSTNGSASKMRIVLQLVLLISPVYLLVPASLRSSDLFIKRKLFEMAAALGSPRPYHLVRLENEILTSLCDIVFHNVAVEDALVRLLTCPAWKDMQHLPAYHPSAQFFAPLMSGVKRLGLLPRAQEAKTPQEIPVEEEGGDHDDEEQVAREILLSSTQELQPLGKDTDGDDQAGNVEISSPPGQQGSVGHVNEEDMRQRRVDKNIETKEAGNGAVPVKMDRMHVINNGEKGNDMGVDEPAQGMDDIVLEKTAHNHVDAEDERAQDQPQDKIVEDEVDTSAKKIVDDEITTDKIVEDDLVERTSNRMVDIFNKVGEVEVEATADKIVEDDENEQNDKAQAPPSPSTRRSARLERAQDREALQMDPHPLSEMSEKQNKRKRESKKPKSVSAVLSEDEGIVQGTKKAPKRPRVGLRKEMPWKLVQRPERAITVDVEEEFQVFAGKKRNMVSPKQAYEVTPTVQVKETLDLLEEIADRVIATYVARPEGCDELPGWSSVPPMFDPENSKICLLSQEDFKNKSDTWIQQNIAGHHLVITDEYANDGEDKEAEPGLRFEKELRAIAPVDRVVDLQVQSIEVGKNADDRVKRGTLRQLVDGAKKRGPIFNALNLPRRFAYRQMTGYTSDMCALDALEFLAPISLSETETPIRNEDFRWAIAGLTGAFHGFHIDSDGLGTWIEPKCGAKWWVIATPKKDGDFNFASTETFLEAKFNLQSVPQDWALEAVYLLPGSRLVMLPNTPHAVYTPKSSVCDGGHFYSTSTLDRSLYGLIHCFVAGRYISNTFHQSTRFVLREMLGFFHEGLVLGLIDKDDTAFPHLPDVMTLSGRVSLISLCVFGILCNVLDFSTYCFRGYPIDAKPTVPAAKLWGKHDVNAMPEFHRMHCMYTRAIALDIINWLEWRYEGFHWKEAFQSSLSRIAGSLYVYKKQATKEKIGSMVPHLTPGTLKTQLSNIFPKTHWLQMGIDREITRLTSEDSRMPTMDIVNFWVSPVTEDGNQCITQRKGAQHAVYTSRLDLNNDGESCRDTLYLAYQYDQGRL